MFFKLHVINFYKNFLNHFFFKSEYHKGTICNFFTVISLRITWYNIVRKYILKMRTQKKIIIYSLLLKNKNQHALNSGFLIFFRRESLGAKNLKIHLFWFHRIWKLNAFRELTNFDEISTILVDLTILVKNFFSQFIQKGFRCLLFKRKQILHNSYSKNISSICYQTGVIGDKKLD